jgi:hypothetical protein
MGDNHPNGMTVMGSNLIQEYASIFRTKLVQYDAPIFYNNPRDPATVGASRRLRTPDPDVIFPRLGVSVKETIQIDATSVRLVLESNLPYHDHFEVQEADGSWRTLTEDPVLDLDHGMTNVRSVDALEFASTVAEFQLRQQ